MLITWGSAYAVTCTIGVTSPPGIVFDPNTPLQRMGNVSVSCTPTVSRETTRNNVPIIYIGIGQGNRTPRSMLQTGTNKVTYEINKSAGAGSWNEAAGTTVATTAGGLNFTMAQGTVGTSQPYDFPFFLNIPAQPTTPVGTYTDTLITATIRDTNNAGAILATTTFTLSATISPGCSFSTAPPTLNINYTSFAAAAASGTSVFALNCKAGTTITNVTVTPVTGTTDRNVGYSMAVGPTTGTGTGTPQNFTVTGTAAAGQAGCTSPCATATPLNNSHTITVSY